MDGYVIKRLAATVKLDDGSYAELRRGQTLPTNVAAGEFERMLSRGTLGTEAEAAAAGLPPELPSLEEQVAGKKKAGKPDLSNLAETSDEELAALYAGGHAPTVKALLAAVGDNVELAKRVLAAESAATKGEPRATLATGLEKVIEGGD